MGFTIGSGCKLNGYGCKLHGCGCELYAKAIMIGKWNVLFSSSHFESDSSCVSGRFWPSYVLKSLVHSILSFPVYASLYDHVGVWKTFFRAKRTFESIFTIRVMSFLMGFVVLHRVTAKSTTRIIKSEGIGSMPIMSFVIGFNNVLPFTFKPTAMMRAVEWPHVLVDFHVWPKTCCICKSEAAVENVTLQRFLPCMNPHMLLQGVISVQCTVKK